jgi:sec-independent protein translocase protein TatA
MHEASYNLALIGPLGTQELIIIGVIMLILFGRRLPEVGRSLGQGIVEFKKGLKDVTDDIKHEVDNADKKPSESARFESSEQEKPKAPAHTSSTQVQAQPEPSGDA